MVGVVVVGVCCDWYNKVVKLGGRVKLESDESSISSSTSSASMGINEYESERNKVKNNEGEEFIGCFWDFN